MSYDRRPQISVEEGAQEDLRRLFSAPETADYGALIVATLEEIENDVRFLRCMHRSSHRRLGAHPTDSDICRLVQQWNKERRNLLRLKIWNYPDIHDAPIPYRVIYAYDGKNEVFYILGVIERAVNYDSKHPHMHRILTDYDSLGI